MNNIDNSFICAPEISSILKKCLATVHRYRKDGRLPKPKYKLNTVYLWDRAEFFVWLDEIKKSKMSIDEVSRYMGKSREEILTYKNIGLMPSLDNHKGELIWHRLDVVEHCEKLIGLVTVREISNKTGYAETTIVKRSKRIGFPDPELTIKGCRLWKWVDVEKYIDKEMKKK